MMHPLKTDTFALCKAWCVPTAYAALTGVPLAEAHSRFAFLQDKAIDKVKGAFIGELILALHTHGLVLRPLAPAKTVGSTMDQVRGSLCPVLIETETSRSGHVMVTHRGYAVDNWTMKIVPIAAFPKPKRRVFAAYTVEPKWKP